MSIRPTIELLGAVAADASVWRIGGQPHVTAVLKATFALVPGGPMKSVAPAPVTLDELAPFLSEAHVSFTGAAHPSLGRRDVRLALFADEALSQSLVDRRVPLPRQAADVPEGGAVELGPEPDGPSGTRCLGRTPLDSNARRALLGYRADAWATGGLREIDSDFDWRYFHAVVPAQRCRFLAGNEWLLLEGLFAAHPTLTTGLPGATPVMRVALPSLGGGPLPLALRGDMLVIDGIRSECSVVWRGSFALPDERALGAVQLFASLELPGEFRVSWPSSLGSLSPSLAPELCARSLERFAAQPATPTAAAPAHPGPSRGVAGPSPYLPGPAPAAPTRAAPQPAALRPQPAAPARVPTAPAAPTPAPTPASLEALFTGTVSLTDRDQIALAMKSSVPFAPTAGVAPPPPKGVGAAHAAEVASAKSGKPLEPATANDSLFETCAIDAAAAQRAVSNAAMPFAPRPAEPPAPPRIAAAPAAASPWGQQVPAGKEPGDRKG